MVLIYKKPFALAWKTVNVIQAWSYVLLNTGYRSPI